MATEETFYDARRRHRRASWSCSALAFAGVIVTGLPVALVLSPPFAALLLVLTDLASLVVPAPDLVADIVNVFLHVVPADQGWGDPSRPLTAGQVLTIAGLALAPGLVVVVAAWWAVQRLFHHAGPEAVVLAAGARPPRAGDVEEQQLVNLVEEMAIAAGVPPPQVRILDAEVANAAIVGRSIDDAIVVVPRHLLDQIGRRPTGALVADLMATAVNGDLRIALSMAATAQTIDVLGAMLAALTNRQARHTLRRLARLTFRHGDRSAGQGDAQHAQDQAREREQEARFIVDELTALARLADVESAAAADCGTPTEGWAVVVTLPALLARTALTMLKLIVVGLLVSPALALLWRRRRMLADATAVELTRDPNALIEALEYLQARGASIPAGPWSHLFVVGPELEKDRLQRQLEEEYASVAQGERRPNESWMAAFTRRRRARRSAREAHLQAAAGATEASSKAGELDLVAFLPPIEQRLQRLVAMGGTRTTAPYRRRSLKGMMPIEVVVYGGLVVVLSPILVALMVVLVGAVMLMALVAAAVEVAVCGLVVALVHLVR